MVENNTLRFKFAHAGKANGKNFKLVLDILKTAILENKLKIEVIELPCDEITELKKKLGIAVEALEEIKCEGHSSLCESMKPYRPRYGCHFEYAEKCLKEIGEIK